MVNQDRSFHGRLRIWKEGWWKEWTPQIVIGGNDVLHGSGYGGDIGIVEGSDIGGNTHFQRYYIATTKHLSWYGEWGLHAAYVYSKRYGHKFNGPAIGVDYRFALPENSTLNKVVNKVKLMAEYDSKYPGAFYTCVRHKKQQYMGHRKFRCIAKTAPLPVKTVPERLKSIFN